MKIPVLAASVLLVASGARAAASTAASDAWTHTPSFNHYFEAAAYAGSAIDTFAGGDRNRVVNPDESGTIKARGVAGVSFDLRLPWFAEELRREHGISQHLYGETVYGSRSTVVEVSSAAAGTALQIIRNATSLEGIFGYRFHFWDDFYGCSGGSKAGSIRTKRLKDLVPRADGKANCRSLPSPYVKAEASFLAVTGGDDLRSIYRGAIGVMAREGMYNGSYFELGGGMNELFERGKRRRFMLDTYLTWNSDLGFLKALHTRPFLQLTVDSDLGPGSDSVQTYIGCEFDLDGLLGR